MKTATDLRWYIDLTASKSLQQIYAGHQLMTNPEFTRLPSEHAPHHAGLGDGPRRAQS
ncbi:MAG: hypothetical protein IPK65_13630 [Gammaproteobacteria bacterium]|nr:hypothetical protein [Gammaproteobacteria bacterium]